MGSKFHIRAETVAGQDVADRSGVATGCRAPTAHGFDDDGRRDRWIRDLYLVFRRLGGDGGKSRSCWGAGELGSNFRCFF